MDEDAGSKVAKVCLIVICSKTNQHLSLSTYEDDSQEFQAPPLLGEGPRALICNGAPMDATAASYLQRSACLIPSSVDAPGHMAALFDRCLPQEPRFRRKLDLVVGSNAET